MHVVIHVYPLILICVMFLWSKDQIRRELWILEERFDASNDIPEVHLTYFGPNHYLMALECRTTW